MELLRPRPLGKQISGVLRREIITGELPSGEAVKEESLAERFAVSRGPIREALRTLESEQLIHKVGRSYEVIGLSPDDADEIYALRRALESVAWAAVAREHTTGATLDARTHVATMQSAARSHDQSAFAQADVDFHSAIVGAAAMKRLSAMWDQLEPSIRMILEVTNVVDHDLDSALAKHVDLLGAVERGDEPEVLRLVDAHLANSRRIIPARG